MVDREAVHSSGEEYTLPGGLAEFIFWTCHVLCVMLAKLINLFVFASSSVKWGNNSTDFMIIVKIK